MGVHLTTPEVEHDPVQHTREDLVDHLILEVNFDGVYEQVQVHLAHLQPGPQFFFVIGILLMCRCIILHLM